MHFYFKGFCVQYIFLMGFAFIFLFAACERGDVSDTSRSIEGKQALHRFMVMDPGHFHAALVFKRPGYESVSPEVGIYAPIGDDFVDHMSRVVPFNTRKENPASWNYHIRLGPDYQERMFEEKFGDVVVLSGQNQLKIDRILACVRAGFNVFSDKPLIIEPEKFNTLESALSEAEKAGLIVLDFMTERYEITSILQRLIVAEESVFGKITSGTPEDPAVIKESVHHFYKLVAGRPNKRPWWYFDTAVQGEGLVDVTTHLVDLSFWILYPERAIDYKKDTKVLSANHWPTLIEAQQFEKVTGFSEFPPQFELNKQGKFPCYCNGEIVFQVDDVNIKVGVVWNFQAPEGAGDTHYSIIKGTRANVVILQGKEQDYKPVLYLEPASGTDYQALGTAITSFINNLASSEYPGLTVSQEGKYWKVEIPDRYRVGHEAHFGQVTDAFLEYLGGKPMPSWEMPNMLAKYYVTTRALEICKQGN